MKGVTLVSNYRQSTQSNVESNTSTKNIFKHALEMFGTKEINVIG